MVAGRIHTVEICLLRIESDFRIVDESYPEGFIELALKHLEDVEADTDSDDIILDWIETIHK
jgi:hypothetical protein